MKKHKLVRGIITTCMKLKDAIIYKKIDPPVTLVAL